MADITSAISTLATKLGALTITSPVSASINRVWNLPPGRDYSMKSDAPVIMCTWQLNNIEWGLDVLGGPRHEFYTVRVQTFIDDANLNEAAQIATAFFSQMILMIHNDYTMGGVFQQVDIRGGEPTLALLDWGGLSYAGTDVFLDIEIVN